jgi:small GTP-binding protein
MLRRILDEARRELLQELRRRLGELRVVLIRAEARDEDQKALARSIAQLDDLFLLVVVGEFNAGKSAVLNALLGEPVLAEGVTPTTSRIELLRYGERRGRSPAGGDFEEITLPVEILREMNVVDTPGTNAVIRGHEALTREFVPRSDLVLFVTSADRPFTESERAFLEAVRAWGKKIVVAVNKIDILETPEDVVTVVEFVRDRMRALLGLRPEVFAVSARGAQRAKATGRRPGKEGTGFSALEAFVTRTLDDAERVRLKLLNPLGVASRVLDRAAASLAERLAVLDGDAATLREIESQLKVHREGLGRDLRGRLVEVEKPLLEYQVRGEEFLGERLRPGGLVSLLDRDGVRRAFERNVVDGLATGVEKRLDAVADALVAGEARLWPAVAARLRRRQAVHGPRVPGLVTETPPLDRARVLEAIRREAQRALESDDAGTEGRRLAGGARRAGAWTALLLLGAAASGVTAVVLGDATSTRLAAALAAAAVVAGSLLLLLAAGRREMARFVSHVAVLRQRLAAALRAGVDRELEASRQRVVESIEPYARFVRSETERLRAQAAELEPHRQGLGSLRARIDALR